MSLSDVKRTEAQNPTTPMPQLSREFQNAEGVFDVRALRDETARLIKEIDLTVVKAFANAILECFRSGGRLFVLGNGGSAASSEHFVTDLLKLCLDIDMTIPIRAEALCSNAALITGLANDRGYRFAFAKRLMATLCGNDSVLAITTSGQSPNVLEALRAAGQKGVATLGICGSHSVEMAPLCGQLYRVKSTHMLPIETAHLAFLHCVTTELRVSLDVQFSSAEINEVARSPRSES